MQTHKQFLQKYFTQDELNRIAQEIAKQEKTTSGEIRVSIRAHRGWLERKRPIHDMALREFYRLKMQKTRDRSGVLLYFLFEEKEFYVLADEGIHLKAKDIWSAAAEAISKDFKEGKYTEGICRAVQTVGKPLQEHYPRKSDDTDELSNAVELS